MPDEQSFSKGDRVELTDCHHMHNPQVKELVGERGTITVIPQGYNDDYQVEFDAGTRSMLDRYWIAPQWLEGVDDDD
jgi:hypothetical protein